jgi:glycine/D-amino acid oxidase-like deaminating enzyme
MGHRPSTPDGLPCIGPASGCADVVHAFGHGHVGLTAGAMTARLVADLISGNRRYRIAPRGTAVLIGWRRQLAFPQPLMAIRA